MCTTASRVRVSGPLSGWAPGLIGWLAGSRFGRQAQINHTRRLALLRGWLERDRFDPVEVDEMLIGELLAVHSGTGAWPSWSGRAGGSGDPG